MVRRLLLVAALFLGSAATAQGFPYPVDVAIGQRWVGTEEAAFYGGVRTYVPLGFSLFNVDVFGIPEVGLDRDTLLPYVRLELTLDSEYATFAAFATRMGDSTRVNVEVRFCILSDKCSE